MAVQRFNKRQTQQIDRVVAILDTRWHQARAAMKTSDVGDESTPEEWAAFETLSTHETWLASCVKDLCAIAAELGTGED